MTKHFIKRGTRRSRQVGDMLLEAMVAMGVVGIIATGPAYITSRAAVSQTQTNAHAQAVEQLRGLLHDQGNALCTTAPGPISVTNQSLAITVNCSALTTSAITVNGQAVVLTSAVAQKVALSVTSDVFGGSGTIVVSE